MIRGALLLLRVSSFATAPSDVLAGYFLALPAAEGMNAGVLVTLPIASLLLLYWGGLIVNDLRDLSEDVIHRPERPLPSGAVSVPAARVMACSAFSGAMILGWLAGVGPGLVATAVLIAVVVYSTWLKRSAAGSAVGMGLCRTLNLGMGMVASTGEPLAPRTAGILVLYFLYVGSLTLVGRGESGTDRRPYQGAAAAVAAACPLLAGAWLSLWEGSQGVLAAWIPLGLLAGLLARGTFGLGGPDRPARVRGWVRDAVLGILLWNGGLLLGAGRILLGIVVAGLFLGSRRVSRLVSPS